MADQDRRQHESMVPQTVKKLILPHTTVIEIYGVQFFVVR